MDDASLDAVLRNLQIATSAILSDRMKATYEMITYPSMDSYSQKNLQIRYAKRLLGLKRELRACSKGDPNERYDGPATKTNSEICEDLKKSILAAESDLAFLKGNL